MQQSPDTALTHLHLYDYATSQSLWPSGQNAALAFLDEAIASYADKPRSVQSHAFIDALGALPPGGLYSVFSAYGAATKQTQGVYGGVPTALNRLLSALPPNVRNQASTAYAEGGLGRYGLTEREIEAAVLNGAWGPIIDLALGEGLLAELSTLGVRVRILASGKRAFEGPNGEQYKSATEAKQALNETIKKGQFSKTYDDGTFSVSDWSGYPSGVPMPPDGTTFRLLSGAEYETARKLADSTNRQLRRHWDVPKGYKIHEVVPVKYGGSPTDPANKVVLPASTHRSFVTPWWNKLQRDIGG